MIDAQTQNQTLGGAAMNALQLARLSRAYGLSGPLAGFLATLIYGERRE